MQKAIEIKPRHFIKLTLTWIFDENPFNITRLEIEYTKGLLINLDNRALSR